MRRAHTLLRRAAALSFALAAMAAQPAQAADPVRFNLAWLPQGSTSGVLVAIAKGYYSEAGLDVSVTRGYGGQRTVNEIDQGLFEFGYGDPISIMLNRAQGGKTVMVGAINTRWPGALCYVEKPGRKIKTIADLKGLVIGGGAASPLHNVIPAWLQANGLPADYVKLLRLDPAVINTAFLDGSIDLAECWEGANKPVLERMAQKNDMKIGLLRYRDFKLNLYGNGIVTSEKLIASNPELVRRFMQATYRGYDYQAKNPADAVELVARQQKLIDRSVLRQQIEETTLLMQAPEAAGKKTGWMQEERMQSTVDFVRKAFSVTSAIKPTDIYTNRFVE
jgi:NitT/TauT family transport system substrate-binding protein